MTSITLKDQYSEVTVTVDEDDLTVWDLLDKLVTPAMSALTYPVKHGEIVYEPFEEKD